MRKYNKEAVALKHNHRKNQIKPGSRIGDRTFIFIIFIIISFAGAGRTGCSFLFRFFGGSTCTGTCLLLLPAAIGVRVDPFKQTWGHSISHIFFSINVPDQVLIAFLGLKAPSQSLVRNLDSWGLVLWFWDGWVTESSSFNGWGHWIYRFKHVKETQPFWTHKPWLTYSWVPRSSS